MSSIPFDPRDYEALVSHVTEKVIERMHVKEEAGRQGWEHYGPDDLFDCVVADAVFLPRLAVAERAAWTASDSEVVAVWLVTPAASL